MRCLFFGGDDGDSSMIIIYHNKLKAPLHPFESAGCFGQGREGGHRSMNLVGKWERGSKRNREKDSKGKWKREKDSKRKVRSRKKLEMGRWKSGNLGGENESRNGKE